LGAPFGAEARNIGAPLADVWSAQPASNERGVVGNSRVEDATRRAADGRCCGADTCQSSPVGSASGPHTTSAAPDTWRGASDEWSGPSDVCRRASVVCRTASAVWCRRSDECRSAPDDCRRRFGDCRRRFGHHSQPVVVPRRRPDDSRRRSVDRCSAGDDRRTESGARSHTGRRPVRAIRPHMQDVG
jgi:hypothetical protein